MRKDYQIKLSRRDSLKWMGAISASALTPVSLKVLASGSSIGKGHWPELSLAPIKASGYGKDPDLIIAPRNAWPRTLTQAQLNLVSVLADIIVPRDGKVPSASEVGVVDVVDEWVSAPYSGQQRDRLTILSAVTWIDHEATLRFNKGFVDVSHQEQLAIIDDIAYDKAILAEEFSQIVPAFSRFRSLVLAAFFCSPQGTKDLGYLGNVPIAGDYPGPTKEAMAHLNQVLDELGLSL